MLSSRNSLLQIVITIISSSFKKIPAKFNLQTNITIKTIKRDDKTIFTPIFVVIKVKPTIFVHVTASKTLHQIWFLVYSFAIAAK